MDSSKWIQGLHSKKGALHRQLGVEQDDKLPVSFLKRIVNAKAGDRVSNPTHMGKRTVKVTHLLERRAILALNLRNIRRSK
jgi:hypothetical protein